MSITEQEWRDEQARVDRVVREIGKRAAAFEKQAGTVKEEIVEIRKTFWDDVTVNFEDAVETAETMASLKQQAEVLGERERLHRHAKDQLSKLKRLQASPYFGRIDFREEGETKAERIYLGIASFLDEHDEQFYVYDWRAPVSSLYYDFGPGPAEYETPGGMVTGVMELKRQFLIRGGVIKSMFDTGVTIGDEMLQEVLGRHADAQMKSIVATIQKEQNRIIRDERSRLLVVQGAAGSGKTSAALQRVAYLLYRFRGSLTADQIVLFSPNDMFNSYVSTVLPELGEENMQQTTFLEYLERRLGKQFALEDPFEQMEYVLGSMHEPGYEARIEGIQFKASLDFMRMLERHAEKLSREGMLFYDLKFRGEALIPAKRIREMFDKIDPTYSIPNRMKLLSARLLEELKELAVLEREKPWVEDEIELLDDEVLHQAYRELQKQKRFTNNTFDDFAREREHLADKVIRRHMKPLRDAVKRLRFLDISGMYQQVFEGAPEGKVPKRWAEICEATIARLQRGELAYEDATPYLYLQELIEGMQTNTKVRHVFVDEAQDYSPFQFAFLKKLFPHAKMTVLGDLNQAIFAHAADRDGVVPASLFDSERTEKIVLMKSYRSTREIVEFTRSMLPGGEAIEPFNRPGKEPTVTEVKDAAELNEQIAARIRELLAAGHRTVAVICKTAEESRVAFEALKGGLELRLIGKETVSFEPGVVVIPSYLAKGVEFDAVILYNASQEVYGRESERKLFYTACTRAMHELHLYHIGEKSLFLK
jgi:DNA helicase-2/ATP-dependent DNA helicase PcrA